MCGSLRWRVLRQLGLERLLHLGSISAPLIGVWILMLNYDKLRELFASECLPFRQADCGDGHCIPASEVCNGAVNCRNGYDEINCTQPGKFHIILGNSFVDAGVSQKNACMISHRWKFSENRQEFNPIPMQFTCFDFILIFAESRSSVELAHLHLYFSN